MLFFALSITSKYPEEDKMKKVIFIVTILILLVFTIPAAAQYFQPVGERMLVTSLEGCVFFPEDPSAVPEPFEFSWPADTPFHIFHGWGIDRQHAFPGLPQDVASLVGQEHKADFKLIMDGEYQNPSGRWRYVDPDNALQTWINVYNFKDSLTGVHEFMAIWSFPACAWDGISVKECDDVNELMTFRICSATVTFTE